jgi:hypothetical protein
MTQYIVFARIEDPTNDHPNEWSQFTAIHARSARSAISKALEGDDNTYKEGTFVAVPARSWRPVQVKVETKTALKFS